MYVGGLDIMAERRNELMGQTGQTGQHAGASIVLCQESNGF
jgi:hypothetical protein